jgi:hypothetical protein
VLVEQADEVAALLAPGGQQRVGGGAGFLVDGRRTGTGCWRLGGAQQLLVGDDVGPVVLAGL